MVGVTSQGSEQEKSAEVRIKQGRQQDRNRNAGTIYRAQEKTHTPRQRLQVWPSLKYTCIRSFRCLAGCRVESLIAGSTRWPALVLQPTRQVSPTITGKSIPDK
ncbi:unnamed protein product [Staurois parvus]|uniref:Uncharacterized protein n=1 Tax=Staurois parvus TaxID=386267 RepID=A0ABN9HPQ5_9NEOB|nr:unnamed protein product [Staurois parvus]